MNGKIYIIKNYINNKVYIGQTIQSIEKRFYQHINPHGNNNKQIICKAIKKYGKDNFYIELIKDNIQTYEELNNFEIFYIDYYNSIYPNGYNMCPGGNLYRRSSKNIFSDSQVKDIINFYINENMSTREIARLFNTNHTAISSVLKNNNILLRDKSCNLPDRTSILNKDILIKLYIEEHKTSKEIAEIFNVNIRTVNRAISKFKLKEYNI